MENPNKWGLIRNNKLDLFAAPLFTGATNLDLSTVDAFEEIYPEYIDNTIIAYNGAQSGRTGFKSGYLDVSEFRYIGVPGVVGTYNGLSSGPGTNVTFHVYQVGCIGSGYAFFPIDASHNTANVSIPMLSTDLPVLGIR